MIVNMIVYKEHILRKRNLILLPINSEAFSLYVLNTFKDHQWTTTLSRQELKHTERNEHDVKMVYLVTGLVFS
jgi:hypothetical protein